METSFLIQSLICLLLHALLFCCNGAIESILWSRRSTEAFEWDEHIPMSIERFLWLFIFLDGMWIGILYGEQYVLGLITLMGVWFTFPFFHNGALYYTRNRINPGLYKRGFWSQPSTTTTATINFSLQFRVVLMIIGVILILLPAYL